MALKTRRWDAADASETKADVAAYLDAVLEDGDPELLNAALGDVARSKGMTQTAKDSGLGRASLSKALSPDGNPEFATVARVLRALRVRLGVTAQGLIRAHQRERASRIIPRGPVGRSMIAPAALAERG